MTPLIKASEIPRLVRGVLWVSTSSPEPGHVTLLAEASCFSDTLKIQREIEITMTMSGPMGVRWGVVVVREPFGAWLHRKSAEFRALRRRVARRIVQFFDLGSR